MVVFAGSPVYRSTIRFIFAAMKEVWITHPDCRLAVTGAAPGDPRADWLRSEVRQAEFGDRVDLVGYLSRSDLLDLYGSAHALLIPLFSDQQSRARFPTKIGEYLAAARPVVTNSIGEIPLYLTDGLDAIVCPPGDPILFGRAIADLLSDPARGTDRPRWTSRCRDRVRSCARRKRLARAFADVAGPACALDSRRRSAAAKTSGRATSRCVAGLVATSLVPVTWPWSRMDSVDGRGPACSCR